MDQRQKRHVIQIVFMCVSRETVLALQIVGGCAPTLTGVTLLRMCPVCYHSVDYTQDEMQKQFKLQQAQLQKQMALQQQQQQQQLLKQQQLMQQVWQAVCSNKLHNQKDFYCVNVLNVFSILYNNHHQFCLPFLVNPIFKHS